MSNARVDVSFDPRSIKVTAVDEIEGVVEVYGPPIHIKVMDLSMGGIIPDGPHLGADASLPIVQMTLKEPLSFSELTGLIEGIMPQLQGIWEVMRDVYSSKFLLD